MMTEYITEWFWDERRNAPNQAQREEIVRCRDCKHFTPKGTHKFENGKVNEDYCEYVRGWMLQITPDGFCAWGERAGNFATCKCGEDIETNGRESVTCPSCGRVVRA